MENRAQPKKKKGFTLVELSIVIVIIGLLIGGVLVGQSLIESARLTSQVRQFQQFDIAINNFREKFGGLPADNKVFQLSIGISPTITGNGNGIIEGEADGSTSTFDDQFEFCNFWFQMSYTQMLPNTNYQIMDGSNARYAKGITIPKSYSSMRAKNDPTQDKIGIVAYGIPSLGKNYYSLRGDTSSALLQRAVNAIDLAALDSKMDDGKGGTGKVIGRSSTVFEDPSNAVGTSCVDFSGNYRTTGSWIDTAECSPRIEMFSQAASK